MSGPPFSGLGSARRKVRLFVSFDAENDAGLLDQLVEQAARAGSSFEISARSPARATTDLRDEPELRRAIRAVDQVVVLCGEHTKDSDRAAWELRIAQEEERPYFLLWGRRELMCTKPNTATPADTMYSWTLEILRERVLALQREAESDQRLAEQRALRGKVPPRPGGAPR